jgi:Mg2+ and Co2+ transporter CorA
MHAKPPLLSPPRTTLFEDIIYYTTKMSKDDLLSMEKQDTALSIPILSVVASEWLTVLDYITTVLTKIEWELESPDYRKDDPSGLDSLDSAVERLHPLRRLIPVYRKFIKEALTTILAPSNLKSPSEKPCHLRKLRSEFEAILECIDRLQIRTQNIISLATAIISIDENKRAMKMNKNLVRVTYLAVVFVPVQFVSSFFSMTPDLASLNQTFWIYFCVAVPLTALCLTIADPPRVARTFKNLSHRGRETLGFKRNST